MDIIILGIESSCDDTSASVIRNREELSNVIANQEVHEKYGGVVPELASRAHQQNIIPAVEYAIKKAGITKNDIHAVAFTKGPGLLGSLMVGASFAKSFAMGMGIPLIGVNHLQGHILSLFIKNSEYDNPPSFPYLCLLVSGGHTQLVIVHDHLKMEIIGKTIDDAAGEAFDKCAKIMGLPYPGGPVIDKLAKEGNPWAFQFNKPVIPGLDFSYSGLKTSFLYFLRDKVKEQEDFIAKNLPDLCASIQRTIVEILLEKLVKAAKAHDIREIAIAGGVAANSELKFKLQEEGRKNGWKTYIPPFKYTTDNAAMIAITGYYKYLNGEFDQQEITPVARLNLG